MDLSIQFREGEGRVACFADGEMLFKSPDRIASIEFAASGKEFNCIVKSAKGEVREFGKAKGKALASTEREPSTELCKDVLSYLGHELDEK